MTWLDFESAGFRVEFTNRETKLRGVVADPSIVADLRFEVASRVSMVGSGQTFRMRKKRSVGTCDACGDAIKASGGVCGLCVLARARALSEER